MAAVNCGNDSPWNCAMKKLDEIGIAAIVVGGIGAAGSLSMLLGLRVMRISTREPGFDVIEKQIAILVLLIVSLVLCLLSRRRLVVGYFVVAYFLCWLSVFVGLNTISANYFK